jgi:hypothetical protein
MSIQHDLTCATITDGDACTCQAPQTLSRAFLCAECEEPIHEEPGETNHWMLDRKSAQTGEIVESVGPFHEDCAIVWMKEHPA